MQANAQVGYEMGEKAERERLIGEIGKLPQPNFDEMEMLNGDRMQDFYDGKIRGWNACVDAVLSLIRGDYK